jgi:hypothetical protein
MVDASACGQKGMHWRTHLGNDKFITRTGDGKAGFAENGFTFRGCGLHGQPTRGPLTASLAARRSVEEYRGWVRCLGNGLWLPVKDVPAASATCINDDLHRSGTGPSGRGKQARDSTMTVIPYLHGPDCTCGGRWCKRPQPPPAAPPPEAPRRRKPLEVLRPPPPRPVAKRPPPRRGCWSVWLWWQYGLAALFVLFLLICYTAPREAWGQFALPRLSLNLGQYSLQYGSGQRAPPLHHALRRWFP